MNKQCKHFQDRVTHHWDIYGTIDDLIHRDSHYADCLRCQVYTKEFLAFSKTLQHFEQSALPEPDFAKMRVNVWEQIDKSKKEAGSPFRILRPAILAPVFTVILALVIWWAIPNQQQMSQEIEVDTEVFLAASGELDLTYYPEESLTMLINQEMGDLAYDYLMETQDSYTMIQESNFSDEEWDQIVQSLSELSI